MDENFGLIRIEDLENIRKQIFHENFILPETNIYVVNDKFIIVVNFPGVPREDVRIEIENNELSLFAKISSNFEFNKCDFYMKEFKMGNYYRKFVLSESIDIENIAAKYENGQLTLVLPKYKKYDKVEIQIK